MFGTGRGSPRGAENITNNGLVQGVRFVLADSQLFSASARRDPAKLTLAPTSGTRTRFAPSLGRAGVVNLAALTLSASSKGPGVAS